MGTMVTDRQALNAMLDALDTDINTGANPAALAIYATGTLGTDDTAIPTGTRLQYIPLAATAFGASAYTSSPTDRCEITLATEGTAVPESAGTAAQCAIYRNVSATTDMEGATGITNLVIKGDVTVTGGGGFLELDSLTLTDTGAIDLQEASCKIFINMSLTI